MAEQRQGMPVDIVNIHMTTDAFARLRVSNPYTLQDNKNVYDAMPYIWDDQQVSGSGTISTFNSNKASVTISVSSSTAGKRVRQTKNRCNYQPGKSQLILITSVIGDTTTGITKRIGYFDDNNGLYFMHANGMFSVGKRSYTSGSVEDTVISQNDWNIDRLDGKGPSEITLDPSKGNIFFINFEWLGVGDVVMGMVSNAIFVPCHVFRHANAVPFVYMSTPNLPIRYEIENNGSGPSSELMCICSSVISEGGKESSGVIRTIDRGITSVNTYANTNIYPLVAIRVKTSYAGTQVTPVSLNVIASNGKQFRWVLLLNPTFVGTSPTFTDISNSALSICNNTDNNTIVTDGTLLLSGYSDKSGGVVELTNIPISFSIGHTIAGVSDTVVLAVQTVFGQSDSFYGSITMREVY